MAQARLLAIVQATDQTWPLDRNQEMAQFQVKTIDTEHLMIHTIFLYLFVVLILDQLIPLVESKVCVRITTGTGKYAGGKLTVTINDAVNADATHKKGALVTDTCLQNLKTIELMNPSINAWFGSVTITDGGRPTSIECEGCTGSASLLNGDIVVDGNSDSEYMADSHCLDGNICSLKWIIQGN